MRKVMLLMMLAPVMVWGQIPKGAEKIIIEGVTYKEVGQGLLDYGFLIDQSDEIFETIETKEFNVKNSNSVAIMRIRIKDSCAILTGEYMIPFLTGNARLITAYAKAGRKPFESMNRFALYFKKTIKYE